MRLAVSLLGVITLASCGAGGQPVDLTLNVPEDAGPITKEFLTICSAALESLDKGAVKARAAKWEVMGPLSGHLSMQREDDVSGGNLTLQVHKLDYPHLGGTNCQLTAFKTEWAEDADALNGISGFRGSIKSIMDPQKPNDRASIQGAWSAPTDSDGLLLLHSSHIPAVDIMSLSLTKQFRQTPN